MPRKSKGKQENATITAAKITALATVVVGIIALLLPFSERIANKIIQENIGTLSPTITQSPVTTDTLASMSPTPMPVTDTPTAISLQSTDTPSVNISSNSMCAWNWEFNTNGDREGWQVNLRVKDLRAEGGALRGSWDQFDPSIISPQQLNIDTSRYKTLSIGYQITSDDIDGQVMWNPNNDNEFSGAMHILYGIVTDGRWHTLNIQLNNDADWVATVNTMRLDPVHDATSGTFAYDYIRVCQ